MLEYAAGGIRAGWAMVKPKFAGKRILVLEDEYVIAADLTAQLMDLGCRVLGPATSPEEACEVIGGHRLDGAVLDINRPDRTTVQLASTLRQRKVPVMVISG